MIPPPRCRGLIYTTALSPSKGLFICYSYLNDLYTQHLSDLFQQYISIHHSSSYFNYKKLTGQHSSRKFPLTGLEGMVYIEATEGNGITHWTPYSVVMLPRIEVLKQHTHFVIGKSRVGRNCVGLTQISHKK